jgi:hypothetical protein
VAGGHVTHQHQQYMQQIISVQSPSTSSVLQQKLTEPPNPRRNHAADLPGSNPSLTALLAGEFIVDDNSFSVF